MSSDNPPSGRQTVDHQSPASGFGASLNRKIVPFSQLAHCGDEVWIEYHGKLYRLQSTRQGKLVLTK
ncbi:MAG: hemin uptake protein HemP [Planctomycetales bacterium]|nr:hemin uptake protein HemP [Planctomycetales bacterium]